MFKLHNERRYLLAFLIAVGLLATASGQEQQCAAVSEYCQNHWECCSGSCMSYLYKCVRNYYIYPYPFLANAPPRKTLDQILELNFGTNNYVRPNVAPQPIGEFDRLLSANEVVSNNQEVLQSFGLQDSILRPLLTNTATIPTQTPVFQTASRLSAVDEIVPITNAVANFSSSTTQSPQTAAIASAASSTLPSNTTNTPSAKCSEIGVKCYKNEECCSERCHGFLHQCVT